MSNERIAPTAHYTAYVWHRLGLPYADLFVTPRGRRLYWSFRAAGEWITDRYPGLPSMTQYLEMRHRAIEHAMGEVDPDRVVELGAGLSRRGVTWAVDHGVDYVEVDLPHMIAAKRAVIEERASAELRARIGARLRHEAVDVSSGELEHFLESELRGAARPIVIAEGLMGYFPYDERLAIARAVAGALGKIGGGSFLCDLRSREGGRTVAVAATILRGAIWLATRGRGAREDFASPEAIRGFFRDAGFRDAEPIPTERATPHLVALRTPARVWRATV
jgi:O-methyltransferase involved in polyketide biosynthesis